MNRKQFITSSGATCDNWTWSWSFINERERLVIFGEWDIYREDGKSLILSEEWQVSRRGKRSAGYPQSKRHAELVADHGYRLMTFPIEYADAEDDDGIGPAKIAGFTPRLTAKRLLKEGLNWYAVPDPSAPWLPDELDATAPYTEGARHTVTVNAYERNPEARSACLAHHGYDCQVCGFNFEQRYGPMGRRYIHVHHLTPVSTALGNEYVVDPVTDLAPICPNCHAMIHSVRPCLSIDELRKRLGADGAP